MDSEQFEEAVRDYEKVCQLDRTRGKLQCDYTKFLYSQTFSEASVLPIGLCS